MNTQHSNRLIHETSPYLLQHAHNPVDWYPWGEEALQKAKEENRVILVSIGYAACHWCHVMERESFEDAGTAAIMNQHFINIKIDREERPDLDHIYMDAVQAMTGSGGWPLNVFLTPDAKPFYGGTYFPPVRAFNRSSWKEVLHGVAQAWRERRTEIESQAENLTAHIASAGNFGSRAGGQADDPVFTAAHCHTIFENLLRNADREWGGFGQAPKFPQTFSISWLLQYHRFTGNTEALGHALLSLDKMLQGGIYDHAGGGFARYSTDTEWLAPHFEKMLYDNALLLLVLCDAYAATKYPRYKKTAEQTIAFVQREMMHPDGGFFAAIDADSEGKEGKFYVWQKAEVEAVLGSDAPLFCEFYDVTETGNWEGENILRILTPAPDFCRQRGLDEAVFEAAMDSCLARLLQKRAERIRPQTDDKILLGWNALFISALCRAAGVFGNPDYAALAEESFAFLWRHLRVDKGGVAMRHTFKEGTARYPAFLDDYAYLVQACIHLQEVTSGRDYLVTASQLAGYVTEHFGEEETGFFFYTGSSQQDVIVRKKEVYDGAVPSGNSVMAQNLHCLGTVFDNAAWRLRSARITGSMLPAVLKHPNSFAVWASAVLGQAAGINEVTIAGPAFRQFRDEVLQHYLPAMILQSSSGEEEEGLTLPGAKPAGGQTLIYLCRHYSCLPPLQSAEMLAEKAKEVQNLNSSAQ